MTDRSESRHAVARPQDLAVPPPGGRLSTPSPSPPPATRSAPSPSPPPRTSGTPPRPPAPPRPSGPAPRTSSAPPCCARPATCSPRTPTNCATGSSASPGPSPARPTSNCTSPPRSATRPPRSPPARPGRSCPARRPACRTRAASRSAWSGVIAPFNAPLILSIRSVAPALALGNAVLLKPDPRTAVCGGLALAAVFAEAGLPEGLLHVLPGGPDVGQALVADPHVPVISFTGSTAAGRAVGEAAGRHLKRAHLELGGNSALIVLEDADLDAVISTAAWGSFFHQGQICMTTGRHLVHASLYEEYVERLAAKADSLAVGDPHREQVHLGPIIDDGQLAKVHGLVEASTARGAKLAAGGTHDRALLPADGPRRRRRPHARLRGGGLRPGRAGPLLRHRRRGRRAGRRQGRTASRWASSPGTPPAASTSPSASRPASSTSTTRRSTTRPSRPSAGSPPPAPAPASAARPTWRPSPSCAGRRCAGTWRRYPF